MNKKNKENKIILAHRGLWKEEKEKNTIEAFLAAIENNFGIETDLRDFQGEIIISHDPAKKNSLLFEDLLKLLQGKNLPLALNIKADGLSLEIKRLLDKYNHTNYFTFDMSIAETIFQIENKLNVFVGINEFFKENSLLKYSKGVWLDSFNSDWFSKKDILNFLNQNKQVAIVSPELHKRQYLPVWEKYKNIEGIMLCTDNAQKAREYFNE